MASGYTQCTCCADDTVSSDVEHPEMCERCEDAGCDDGVSGCMVPSDFDADNETESD